MKKDGQEKPITSGIYQTECDPETGIGLLGFVITYPDAHIENQVLEYTKDNYQEIRHEITLLHQTATSRSTALRGKDDNQSSNQT